MIKNWWLLYQQTVKGKTISLIAGNDKALSYWQDLLFFNFLFYCLPISFLAAIPSVIIAIKDGYASIFIVDIAGLVLLSVITFTHQIALKIRKLFIIFIFYAVALFLINNLGYTGPGVFYLFAITILTALVCPKKYGFLSIAANTIILSFYALVIRFHLFHSPLTEEYTFGKWIAFSCNLIFLSIILVALIFRIFKSLQTTISNQVDTENELSRINFQIKKSEASLKAIFESAADGFILLDEELIIKAFNSKAREYILLDHTPQDFTIGTAIFDYIKLSRQAYFKSAIQKVYGGEFVEYDRRFSRSAGSQQWVRFTLTPVFEDQLIRGVCITGRDVTVRKLYLKNVEDQNRTFREIAWMQSHLVRAPLARIMGLANLLKTSRDEYLEETIDYIITSADELDAIINKITEESNAIITKYPVSEAVDSRQKDKNKQHH